jgi:hypothetical protein
MRGNTVYYKYTIPKRDKKQVAPGCRKYMKDSWLHVGCAYKEPASAL